MDALTLDQMLPEYQEAREEFVQEVAELQNDQTPSDDPPSFDRNLNNDTTVPVCDSEPELSDPGLASRAENNPPASRDSTSSTSSIDYVRHSGGSTSLYQPGFIAPSISYERDNEQQKLIAVIGREFDCPHDISLALQRLMTQQPNCDIPVAKFVPFTLKRKMLIRGSFDNRELKKHDLICMCYNASEARLLLTGVDGFYTSLLKYVETSLGSNKVAFLISNYSPNRPDTGDNTLIHTVLKTRLYNQEPLRVYLDQDQVLCWNDCPNDSQAQRLVKIASLEPNPQNFLGNATCCVL